MADLIIPDPDVNGYWHFTYVTTAPDGKWYGGKRSTKRHPLSDPYLGSGDWIKGHPNQDSLRREIVGFYGSVAEVYAAEAALVPWSKVHKDPLCMNRISGGKGWDSHSAQRRSNNPQWVERHLAALRRVHADPKVKIAHLEGVRRNGSRPEFRKQMSEKMNRLWSNPEYKARMIEAVKLRLIKHPLTQEWRDECNAKRRGKKRTPESIAKTIAGITGQKRTPESRARMSAANIIARAKMSPEAKAAVVERLRISRSTPQAMANIKAAARRRAEKQRLAKQMIGQTNDHQQLVLVLEPGD